MIIVVYNNSKEEKYNTLEEAEEEIEFNNDCGTKIDYVYEEGTNRVFNCRWRVELTEY